MPLATKEDLWDVRYIQTEMFCTDERIAQHSIGAGEDVFMVGRFIDADGGLQNRPAVRFGNISLMPVPIKQRNGATVASYCIDMHSRTGYSGSPVFVYRKPGQDLTSGSLDLADQFMYLLGIHWGQFPEQWEIVRGGKGNEESQVSLDADARYVEGMSGMTCVAPAPAIMSLLDSPKLRAQFDELNESWSRQQVLVKAREDATVVSYDSAPDDGSPGRAPLREGR